MGWASCFTRRYCADVAESSQSVRVYAPVGTHEDLLPYLVRRLLENGANTSFVHQFLNPQIPVEQVVTDPISVLNRPADKAGRPRASVSRTRSMARSG